MIDSPHNVEAEPPPPAPKKSSPGRWLRLSLLVLLWVVWIAAIAAVGTRGPQPSDVPQPAAVALFVSGLGLTAWLIIEIGLGLVSLARRLRRSGAGVAIASGAAGAVLVVAGLAARQNIQLPQPNPSPSSSPSQRVTTPVTPTPYPLPQLITPTPFPALSCPAQPAPAQVAADGQIITKAASAKVGLLLPRSCAGFSLFYQQGLDSAIADDFNEGLLMAYPRIIADSGITPKDRIGVFILADREQRAAACKAVLGTCQIPPDASAPGIQHQGHVWIDASRFKTQTFRRSGAAHEMLHAFVLAASRRTVPDWLNEGLAVYDEVLVPAERQPLAAERDAARYRKIVLDAASGKGSVPLFPLSEITSVQQWDANYGDQQKQDLEYAEGYAAVKWLIDNKGGQPPIWKLISAINTVPFPDALSRTYNLTLAALESQLRATWASDIGSPPDTARFTVKLTPGGIQGNTAVFVFHKLPDGTQVRSYTRSLKPGEYSFEFNPASGVTSKDPNVTLTSDASASLSCECFMVLIANANYRGSTGAAPRGNEALEYELAYGKWAAAFRTYFPAETSNNQGESVPGKPSDPFPDGNQVTVSFAPPEPPKP